MDARILVVDDDLDVLTSIQLYLKRHFKEVIISSDPTQLNQLISKEQVDVILLDMNFRKGENDGKEGLYWLKHIHGLRPDIAFLLMTAYGEVELAVEAIKQGASDFVIKPWKNEKLLASIISALRLKSSKAEVNKLKKVNQNMMGDQWKLIGESVAMKNVKETIKKVAATDANVLILGENGTGKEVVSRIIHQQSLRNTNTFVSVDLGALNENLFETELFGSVKGAYTDAKENRAGRFELADKGTLFLDEIGNLSVPLQAKLLTAIQNMKVTRVGSIKEIPVDVRLICATNMPLYDMVYENSFRQDLLYRINTVELRLPSLRERADDIPLLADNFLKTYTKKYGKEGMYISEEAMQKLMKYKWPGNVRELQHSIERAVILGEGVVLKPIDFLLKEDMIVRGNVKNESLNLSEMEKALVLRAIEKNGGNISKAAKDLGITRTALYRRLEKYDI